MSSYGRHNRYLKEAMLAIQEKYPNIRIWPSGTGAGYNITCVKQMIKAFFNKGDVKGAIRNLRLIKFGKVGSADITGITDTGKRLEIEIKTGAGIQREDQKIFERIITERKGIYIVFSDKYTMEEQLENLGRKISNE